MKRTSIEKVTVNDKVATKAKNWLKHHDPSYIEERKKYADDPDVKERRNVQSRSRRAGTSAAVNILKKFGPLKDAKGNEYAWNTGRVCKNNAEVVRRGKNGMIYYMPYSDEEELKDPKYDAPIVTDEDKKLYQTVKRLFEGDDDIEAVIKQTKIVVAKELSDEDMFWKSLSTDEKENILKKLKPPSLTVSTQSNSTPKSTATSSNGNSQLVAEENTNKKKKT